ncbi:MAG: tRNA uridine-5-carboxymethylaminomethyl(34) synthesis GTPase MnmE [Desulfuromonas sp.]|nr:MAG: tRNA uridine-5-carboxymethylaminomethyl(34) synthesis GTPase MnmE [Desulfuromonas sp.]
MHIDTTRTIMAPATPPGEGGVAVLRLSGPDSFSILTTIFRPSRPVHSWQNRYLYLGHIVDDLEDIIDEVLAVRMQGPASFTGEDVVEIHCHGGTAVVRRILKRAFICGAVPAQAGEFTFRAFLNGKMDLSQAEAVADLIHARSEGAQRVALRQQQGDLYHKLVELRQQLVVLLAHLETYIDFPEEDIPDLQLDSFKSEATSILLSMERLVDSYQYGRLLRDGAHLLLIGRPNVGKSSLLNALLGESRALVTDIPGTTRDTVEEDLLIEGVPVRLVDTAGIRVSDDPVESLGIARSLEKLTTADLVLFLVDASVPLTDEDSQAYERLAGFKTLLVFTKGDLPAVGHQSFLDLPHVSVSIHDSKSLLYLKQKVVEILGFKSTQAEASVVIASERHSASLQRAINSVRHFISSLSLLSLEFLAVDLHDALHALGDVTGETTPDEILDQIFSRFCIGK